MRELAQGGDGHQFQGGGGGLKHQAQGNGPAPVLAARAPWS